MPIPPRTCACGYMMEFRAASAKSSYRWCDDAFRYPLGVYFCAHCDLGCVGADNGCHQCKKMGVKK